MKAEEAEKALLVLKARKAAATALATGKFKSTDLEGKKDKTKSGFHGGVCASVHGTVHPRQAGVLAGAMHQMDLSDLSCGELEKHIPKQVVREKNEVPPPDPSDSKVEEVMACCSKLLKPLQDTSVVWSADEDAAVIRSMIEQTKLAIAVDKW